MTRRISLVTATVGMALALGVPAAWGDDWGSDRQDGAVRVSPDLTDRAVAADHARLSQMLDARERALGASAGKQTISPLDARERAFDVKRVADPLVGKLQEASVTPFVDDRFRIDHSNVPVHVSATTSGRDLEWPQIGIGFGLGIVLMLGLYLAMKATRQRPLAH